MQISPPGIPGNYQPAVTWTGLHFFVVWSKTDRLLGRLIGRDGNPVGDTIHIASTGYVLDNDAASGNGVIMAAWADYDSITILYGQILSSSGSPIGSPFIIASIAGGYCAVTVCHAGNHFLVVYNRYIGYENNVFGRFYDESGQALGSEFAVSSLTGNCPHTSVTAGPDDRYFSAWSRSANGYTDIYGTVDIMYGLEERISTSRRAPISGSYIVSSFEQIKGLQGMPVTIYDATGQLVFKGRLKDIKRDFHAGVYFMVAEDCTQYKIILVTH